MHTLLLCILFSLGTLVAGGTWKTTERPADVFRIDFMRQDVLSLREAEQFVNAHLMHHITPDHDGHPLNRDYSHDHLRRWAMIEEENRFKLAQHKQHSKKRSNPTSKGVATTPSTRRCGPSWFEANHHCGISCPTGSSSECGENERCFPNLSTYACENTGGTIKNPVSIVNNQDDSSVCPAPDLSNVDDDLVETANEQIKAELEDAKLRREEGEEGIKTYLEAQKDDFIANVKAPDLSAYVCVQVDVDLLPMTGIPLVVHVGLLGGAGYKIDNHCWNVRGDVHFGFSLSLPFIGKMFNFGLSFQGRLSLEERTQKIALEQNPRWHPLPDDSDPSKCHAGSPWQVIQSFLLSVKDAILKSKESADWSKRLWEIAKESDHYKGFNDYQAQLKLNDLEDALRAGARESGLSFVEDSADSSSRSKSSSRHSVHHKHKNKHNAQKHKLKQNHAKHVARLAEQYQRVSDLVTDSNNKSQDGEFSVSLSLKHMSSNKYRITQRSTHQSTEAVEEGDPHFRSTFTFDNRSPHSLGFSVLEVDREGNSRVVQSIDVQRSVLRAQTVNGATYQAKLKRSTLGSIWGAMTFGMGGEDPLLVFQGVQAGGDAAHFKNVMEKITTPYRAAMSSMFDKMEKYAAHTESFLQPLSLIGKIGIEIKTWFSDVYEHHTGRGLHRVSNTDGVPDKKAQLLGDVAFQTRDDRVLNFDAVRTQSEYNTEPSFHMEVARSAANLWTRFAAGIHAIFSIYFVNDPMFHGECSGVGATFYQFYETHGSFPTHRARTLGTGNGEYEEEPTINPWLNFDWIGDKKADEHHDLASWAGQDNIFFKQRGRSRTRLSNYQADDPLYGQSGYTELSRETSSLSYPALVCEMANAAAPSFDFTKLIDPDAYEEDESDRMEQYFVKNACQVMGSSGAIEMRTECERAIFSKLFKRIFPSLYAELIETQESINSQLASMEDYLHSLTERNVEIINGGMSRKLDTLIDLVKAKLSTLMDTKTTAAMKSDFAAAFGSEPEVMKTAFDIYREESDLLANGDQEAAVKAVHISGNKLLLAGLPAAARMFAGQNLMDRKREVLTAMGQKLKSFSWMPPLETTWTAEAIAETKAPEFCKVRDSGVLVMFTRQLSMTSWRPMQDWQTMTCVTLRVSPFSYNILVEHCWASLGDVRANQTWTPIQLDRRNEPSSLKVPPVDTKFETEKWMFAGERYLLTMKDGGWKNMLKGSDLLEKSTIISSVLAMVANKGTIAERVFNGILTGGALFGIMKRLMTEDAGDAAVNHIFGAIETDNPGVNSFFRSLSFADVAIVAYQAIVTIFRTELLTQPDVFKDRVAQIYGAIAGNVKLPRFKPAFELKLVHQCTVEWESYRDSKFRQRWNRRGTMAGTIRGFLQVGMPYINGLLVNFKPSVGIAASIDMTGILHNFVQFHRGTQSQIESLTCVRCITNNMTITDRVKEHALDAGAEFEVNDFLPDFLSSDPNFPLPPLQEEPSCSLLTKTGDIYDGWCLTDASLCPGTTHKYLCEGAETCCVVKNPSKYQSQSNKESTQTSTNTGVYRTADRKFCHINEVNNYCIHSGSLRQSCEDGDMIETVEQCEDLYQQSSYAGGKKYAQRQNVFSSRGQGGYNPH